MKCVLELYPVFTGVYHATSTVGCRCQTHHWDFGSSPTSADTQCPLGRIEDKVDESLARIEELMKRLSK